MGNRPLGEAVEGEDHEGNQEMIFTHVRLRTQHSALSGQPNPDRLNADC
jgi:hypothetical protein